MAPRSCPARLSAFRWLGLLVMAGAACQGLAAAPPTFAVPSGWSNADVTAEPGDMAEYWTALGDPVLSQLVARAMTANLDLAQAAARLDAARAGLAGAQARYLPQVNATVGASKDLGPFASDSLGWSVGGSVSWEIDLTGRIRGAVAASRADLAAAGYSLGDVQRLVAGQVAQGVISARAIAAQIEIARSTLAVDDDNLQVARWRNDAGLVSSLDVEQARTQRAQSAATLAQLEANLAATTNSLSLLIGEPPGGVLALLRQHPSAVPSAPARSGLATPAAVLRRRPDVRAAEASLMAASARVGVARRQLLPLVQLTGQVSTGSTTLGNLFDVVTGALVGRITQLIFDGGAARANARSAEATARGALATWQRTVLAALGEVETAVAAERGARERVVQLEQALDAAGNAALLARSQYRAGLTDFRALLSAESQLLTARNALVQARAARASAFVQLTQALGGGWTATNRDALPDAKSATYNGNPP